MDSKLKKSMAEGKMYLRICQCQQKLKQCVRSNLSGPFLQNRSVESFFVR